MADFLGMPRGRAARKATTRILRTLEHRYGLIEWKQKEGQEILSLRELPGDTVSIPEAYWTYGWSTRLRFPAKAMYILGRYYSANSTSRPRWSLSWSTIDQRHFIGEASAPKANTEIGRASCRERV